MSTDDIEDGDWVEVAPAPGSQAVDPKRIHPESIGRQRRRDVAIKWGKRLLMGIGGITTFGFVISAFEQPPPEQPSSQAGGVADQAQPQSVESNNISATEIKDLAAQLVGTWVQAERGGEDGRTRCNDAEVMTAMNGGETNVDHYFRNGKIQHTLWYDSAFEQHGEPDVKSSYNEGSWEATDNTIHLKWDGGKTGLFGSDLGAGDDNLAVVIHGNEMRQTEDAKTVRYVRCKE